MLTGSTFTYLHDDMIGTPKAATNASQTVVWRGNYTPFGPAISTSGTATINLRMPGQYFDAETGLWHNGRRDYSTTLGRYIQSDPIGLAGGINTYSYASNRPMDLSDPSGEDDINLFPPGSYQWLGENSYNPQGVFSIGGHGGNVFGGQFMESPDGSSLLSPLDIAMMTLMNQDYTPGETVVLHSCGLGAGGLNSFAQQLSYWLDAPVIASDSTYWVQTSFGDNSQSASFSSGPTPQDNSGQWYQFSPYNPAVPVSNPPPTHTQSDSPFWGPSF